MVESGTAERVCPRLEGVLITLTKVLLGWQADAEEVALARSILPDCDVSAVPTHATLTRFDCDPGILAQHAKDADILATFTIGPEVYRSAERMKLLLWLHSGFDPVDFAALKERHVLLANASGSNATAVAEHAFALLLALAKRIVERDARVKQGGWAPFWASETSSALLAGSTVTIVGLGEIGRRVAQRARAFECRVIGVRRSGRPSPEADVVYGPDQLCEALSQADFVVMATPHTAETNAMISHRELAAMKPGSFLVNVCRGRVVDEIALRAALDSGHLGGFASDVWWVYANSMPEGWHYAVPSRLGIHQLKSVVASHDSAVDNLKVKTEMITRGLQNGRAYLDKAQMPNLVFDGEKMVGSLADL